MKPGSGKISGRLGGANMHTMGTVAAWAPEHEAAIFNRP
jgi:hypothetical protein